jgi:CheY-like chemotaxis protein
MDMTPTILHVEDNPDDVMLTRIAFRRAAVAAQLQVATDGDLAVAILQKDPIPAFLLLDIKLPSISGLDVLAWVRQQERLRRLPAIMLTSSVLPEDINRAYDLGANSYLLKPTDPDALVELVKVIDHYWLRLNTPPVPMDQ